MHFNTEGTNNKPYLECIFYLSCWEERQTKEKCVLKHSFNSVDGEWQICENEKWMLKSDFFLNKWKRNIGG